MNYCRRPVGSAAGLPVTGCLAIVIYKVGLLGKGGSVVETIRIDHGAGAGSGLADGPNIDAAALADQELGGACAKAIGLDLDLSAGGLALRSKRYSMLVLDGVVKLLNVEPDAGKVDFSGAQDLLAEMK